MRRMSFWNCHRELLGFVLASVLLGFAFCQSVYAQPQLENDLQTWDWVTLTLPVSPNKKTLLYLEGQTRIGNLQDRGTNNDFTQLLLRPALGYKIRPNVSIWQGYAWAPIFEPVNKNENRIYQQLLIDNKFKALSISNRTRLEERWIEHTGGTSVRFRHQLGVTYPLTKDKKWNLVASDEFFITLKGVTNGPSAGFDQNRAFLGVSRKLTEQVNAEAGYMNVYTKSKDPVPDRMFHVIVLNLKMTVR